MTDRRERLGRAIAERRLALGLSVNRAAKLATIDRGTWTATESGRHETSGHVRALIERVLRWAPGSTADILAGGEPTELEPEPEPQVTPIVHVEPTLEEELARLKSRRWPSREAYRAAVRAVIDAYTDPA